MDCVERRDSVDVDMGGWTVDDMVKSEGEDARVVEAKTQMGRGGVSCDGGRCVYRLGVVQRATRRR